MRFFTFRNGETGEEVRKLCDADHPPDYMQRDRHVLREQSDLSLPPTSVDTQVFHRMDDNHIVNPSTPRAYKETINGFMSRHLPKRWPWAPRHVKSGQHKGSCVFHSETEAKEACKRAVDAGENDIRYDH